MTELTFYTTFSRHPKGFRVSFMHTGEANGWHFPEQVLRAAAPLADGVHCFVDHNLWGKSIRDLAGVFSEIAFDGANLTGIVSPTGPAQGVLKLLGETMLSDASPKPRAGFSPVIRFTSQDQEVQEILEFQSVDLVIEPAFKSQFLSEAFQKKGSPMNETNNPEEQFNQVQQAMCGQLLEASLQNAALPERATGVIRARFQGRVFTPEALASEIQALKDALAEANAPVAIQGQPRITGLFSSADQIQAAVYDLFNVPRDKGSEALQVQRLSGIRELYVGLTGDREFHGALYPELASFQHTTATFPGLVKNALNKALVEGWNQLGRAGYDWWQKIVKVEHFTNLNTVTWMRLGTIASLPIVEEGADYTELYIGDGSETSTWEKAGGFIGVTLEAILRDETRKIAQIPVELGKAAIRNISENIAEIFSSNSGVGPTLADGGALFNNTAVTTVGGHANLLTTALGSDLTAWRAVETAVFNQPLRVADISGYAGTGKKQAIRPRYCLVPQALRGAAEDLFLKSWNAAGPVLAYGLVEPLVVPEWTDTTDWAAACDPVVAPAIMIGEIFGLQPEIFVAGSELDSAVFTNDESRFKLRHFLTYGVSDFRPLHKSNVA